MEFCVRWMLLSLLAVGRHQADAFTFEPADHHESGGVGVVRYPPAPRGFIASAASSRTGLPWTESSMHENQPLGAAPGVWRPRAKKPTTTPKPDGPSTTTKKPPCPRDRPYCNQPYWGPNLYHHHFVLLPNDKEPHYPGHDDHEHDDDNRYPTGPQAHDEVRRYPTGPLSNGGRYPTGPQAHDEVRRYPTGPLSDGGRYPTGPQEHGEVRRYPTGPHDKGRRYSSGPQGDGRRYQTGQHEHNPRRYPTGPHGRPLHQQRHWPEAQRHQLQRLQWPKLNRG